MRTFTDLFPGRKPIIGMVHLAPLPGSPRWGGSLDRVVERALADAAALAGGGVDGLLVENYGDVPFPPDRLPEETLAALVVAAREVVRAVRLPVGVNALRNDAAGALAAAVAAGASFIRVNVHTGVMVTDQGFLVGRAHDTLRRRAALAAEVLIFADVFVKHATPLPGTSLEQAAADTAYRGLADALIVSGTATGAPTDLERVRRVRAAVPDRPVLVGSGVTEARVQTVLATADGAIVGSAFERGGVAGAGVEAERVQRLVASVR
ncbi:MAG: BtpA/SgcQ family protein [Armatimonadetes bacterium]|nr:BtpA/SgcQ family protein [Armatimonadota bacterium]